MQLKEAFRKLYLASDKEHLLDPFYVYSFLSDYCSSDYQSKKFIKLYYEVSIKVNIFDYLINNEIEVALKLLKSEQKKYDKFFTFSDFKSCVFISLLAYKPDFFDHTKNAIKVANKPVRKAPKVKKSKVPKPIKPRVSKKIKTNPKKSHKIKKLLSKFNVSIKFLFKKIRCIFKDIKMTTLFRYSKANAKLKPFDLYVCLGLVTELILLVISFILMYTNLSNFMNAFLIVLAFILWLIISLLELSKYSYPHIRSIRRGLILNIISFFTFITFVIFYYVAFYQFLLYITWIISLLLIYRFISLTSKYYLETHTIFGGIKYE